MPSLSGCIVVRNGKNSVWTCLDALLPLANEYVVIDTGSTDGTIELVNAWKEQHSNVRVVFECVGNKFHDEEGIFDFGAAKNYAISVATCQYVMWIDINDHVQKPAEVRAAFEKIVNRIPNATISLRTRVDKSFTFPRARIAPRLYAHMVGSIHEYLENTAPDAQLVTTMFEINNFKTCRDISRNVRTLKKEWRTSHTQRIAFYLGNSARDVHDLESALTWYSIAVDEFPDQNNEERWKAMETICDICFTNREMNDVGLRSLQMIEERPTMPEGYYYRAQYNYSVGDYPKAYKCLDMLMKLNVKPPATNMWYNPKIYDRKAINNMLAEVGNRAKYANMQPMKPEVVEDLPAGMYSSFGNMRPMFGSGLQNNYGYSRY